MSELATLFERITTQFAPVSYIMIVLSSFGGGLALYMYVPQMRANEKLIHAVLAHINDIIHKRLF